MVFIFNFIIKINKITLFTVVLQAKVYALMWETSFLVFFYYSNIYIFFKVVIIGMV